MVLGDAFAVDGVMYRPADTLNYDAVGYAGENGGAGITGAHRTLPMPSYVEVTSLESGHTILVRIDQRGPMTGSRLVDLSPKAWAQLGIAPGSHPAVRVRRVNPPEQERALLRLGQAAPMRMETPPGLLAALKRKLGVAAPLAVLTPAVSPHKAEPAPIAPAPKAVIKPDLNLKPEPKVAAKPAGKPPVKPAIAPPKAAVAVPLRGLIVQVAAFSNRERAETAAKVLGGSVMPAGQLWRVRTGPFPAKVAADAALAKARAAGYADARVLQAP